MLLAHMVINAVDAALDDRKEAFNGIGVSVAPNVLIGRMIDRAMTGELLSNLPIDAAFIGTKMRICGFGDFVTRVVLRLVREADALGGAVEISGDHIPADTAAGQMIRTGPLAFLFGEAACLVYLLGAAEPSPRARRDRKHGWRSGNRPVQRGTERI